MKTFVFLASLLIAVFAENINALACDPSNTYTTSSFSYGTPPCALTATYCCEIDPLTGDIIITFLSLQPDTPGDNCVDAYIQNPYFQAFVENNIMVHFANNSSCAGSVKPCPDNTVHLVYTRGACWLISNTVISNGMGGYTHVRAYACCPDANCETRYTVCLDYNTFPATLQRTLLSKTMVGTLTCSPDSPILPPDTYNWSTPCFQVSCY